MRFCDWVACFICAVNNVFGFTWFYSWCYGFYSSIKWCLCPLIEMMSHSMPTSLKCHGNVLIFAFSTNVVFDFKTAITILCYTCIYIYIFIHSMQFLISFTLLLTCNRVHMACQIILCLFCFCFSDDNDNIWIAISITCVYYSHLYMYWIW